MKHVSSDKPYSYDSMSKGGCLVSIDTIGFCVETYSDGRNQIHTDWMLFWVVGACATDGYQLG
jgi:hypothetical protein